MGCFVHLSGVSFLTYWYLLFWNKALKTDCLRKTILKKYLGGCFGNLIYLFSKRRLLSWMKSYDRIKKISLIFLNCYPLRKLIPIFVNLGFFFDRMIEYSIAIRGASIKNGEMLLDIGPYYSFFPSYLASQSHTIALDVNRDAMIFQKKVSKAMGKDISERLELVIADATRLPFKDDNFDKIFTISTIEHIKKDNLVAKESGRVLKRKGFCVMSFPFSKIAKEPDISPYFQRFYTKKSIQDRIVSPSLLSLEEISTFCKTFVSSVYHVVPAGWFIFKDLLIGLTLFKLEEIFLSKDQEGKLAVIKLRKHI